ncbi:MAG: carbohydrate binding family 9 domain-containing protein [Bacteroidetes bacterium]|nr:carbohydrate binding family 9 domain-containing protein [Bacteroidota bacterium]
MRGIIFFLLFSAFASSVFSNSKNSDSTQTSKKEYTAVRISHPPKIDADLNDSCWMNIPVATDFIQSQPNPLLPSRKKTDVKLAYDNNAIYVLAIMYDSSPDSILHELSTRDNAFFGPNADAFGVLFDTYHDKQNAFLFSVTAAGVQADTRLSGDNFDDSWNAVWESKVKITNYGWVAEYRIPYSALRFPKKEIQEWGINFSRQIRRCREFSNWNPIDPKVNGMVVQAGILHGISNIKSPLRLSVSPYISTYAYNFAGQNSYAFNGGADVKYGINESFTMDMMLIPDFGQVRSDDKILNLSPFEVRYDERRSFFTEGTELFNRANIFYSRRVGGIPLRYNSVYDSTRTNEIVDKNPQNAQLYNATKISGRTKDKLGIGFFNAVTAPAYATLRDTLTRITRNIQTQPLANYNVLVLDQELKNNSHVSLINTNVSRQGKFEQANVTGTEIWLVDKSNTYAIRAFGNLSQLHFPDSAKTDLGYRYLINVGKISGNYTVSLVERATTQNFNPNDFGYIARTNEFAHFLNQSYNIYKPFWKIVKMTNDLGIDYFMHYNNPRAYSLLNIDWNTDIDFKNYFTWGFFGHAQPIKNNYDFYQPRTIGRYYVYSSNYGYGTYFSTDSRKAFHLSGSVGKVIFNERNRNSVEFSLSPRYRFNDKFNMTYSYWQGNDADDVGFVDNVNDTIIFGVRNVFTKTNTIEGNYLFTPRMSLSLRVRHYWSQVKYSSYFALNDIGKDSPTSYNTSNDINFNAFNIDLAFTWQFHPGSEISIVWKNAILTEKSDLVKNYYENLNRTIGSPQSNSFSIKILYYLDYQMLKRKK